MEQLRQKYKIMPEDLLRIKAVFLEHHQGMYIPIKERTRVIISLLLVDLLQPSQTYTRTQVLDLFRTQVRYGEYYLTLMVNYRLVEPVGKSGLFIRC